jgi:outer membrane protein assembly factor BamB
MILLGTMVFGLLSVALNFLPRPPSEEFKTSEVMKEVSTPAEEQPAAVGVKHDWLMFGGSPARNLVNTTAKNIPTIWDVTPGKEKNLKWKVDVGNRAYSQPVCANGKVYVATNNARPRDPKKKGFLAVLMCFDEKTGAFLWQNTHEMPPPKVLKAAKEDGLCSTPTIDGDWLYYLAPAAQLICAEASNGKEIWKLDMMKDLKVFPYELTAGSPLVVGDLVFVVTGNGVDVNTEELPAPDAPSFLAVNKKDGTVKWKSNLPGKNIIEGQWGNPAWAEVNGKPQVIFPGGDCYLYSFEPETGKLLWKFFCNSMKETAAAKKKVTLSNYLMATPVVYENKVYIGAGMYPENPAGGKIGHFWCIDLVKATQNASKDKDLDVSPRDDNFDPAAAVNKDSALAWHYGGELVPRPKFGRSVVFGRTASTAAVQDGLVYITEEAGYLHCLDAATGKKYWEHDLLAGVWGSPLWVDNKVYIGSDNGEVQVLAHGKVKKVLGENDLDKAVQAPPAVANGTLYVVSKMRLYAISAK